MKKKIEKKNVNVKKAIKKVAKKEVVKKTSEKDGYGFQKNSKSSGAIAMLASGKSTGKEARKSFETLSFGKLLLALNAHGFKVVEDKAGLCSITPSRNAPKAQNKGQVEAGHRPKVDHITGGILHVMEMEENEGL